MLARTVIAVRWGWILLILAGCQGGVKTIPVTGQVLADSEPLAKAVVVLHPVNTHSTVKPTGQTDDKGRFVLTSQNRGDGAPPGDYLVTVTWFVSSDTPDANGDFVSFNRLPSSYGNPAQSGLKVTIAPDTHELPVIQLNLD